MIDIRRVHRIRAKRDDKDNSVHDLRLDILRIDQPWMIHGENDKGFATTVKDPVFRRSRATDAVSW